MTMANPYTFPFKKNNEDKRMPAIKWQQVNNKYEIHVKTLEDIDLSVLIPHCIETRAKIKNEVSVGGHRGPSLFSVFPRTLSTTLNAIWDQVVSGNAVQTEQTFDEKLKEFVACHATEEDRHELVQQLLQPVKPREVTVQAFYYRILELNEYVKWLPGEDEEAELTPAQIKKAVYDGMPRTWKDRFVSAGQSQIGMTTPEIVRYFRAQEKLSISKQNENTQSQRRAARNGNHNGKRRNDQHATKPDEASSNKKPKKAESGNRKGTKRITSDDPCPIHAGMNHTWGECYANAYNPKRQQKDQGKSQDANKKAKANKFAATAEKHAEASSDEDSSLMETEGKISQSSCFTVETMVQLDNHLTSESCSCEQIELNTNACESFYLTLEECFASGEDNYENNPSVLSKPVTGNLKLRPIGMMTVGSIQKQKHSKPLRVLFDSGSDVTFINLASLPKGIHAKRTSVQLRTVAGSAKVLSRAVTLENVCFPELSPTRRFDKEITAIVSSHTGSYDVILGNDVLVPAGIDILASTQTIQWFDVHVPWQPTTHPIHPQKPSDVARQHKDAVLQPTGDTVHNSFYSMANDDDDLLDCFVHLPGQQNVPFQMDYQTIAAAQAQDAALLQHAQKEPTCVGQQLLAPNVQVYCYVSSHKLTNRHCPVVSSSPRARGNLSTGRHPQDALFPSSLAANL
jgi:hypothetical protein